MPVDLKEVSEKRLELYKRLVSRMQPIFEQYDYDPSNPDAKPIEFGGFLEDYKLLSDLRDALLGDRFFFLAEDLTKNKGSGA